VDGPHGLYARYSSNASRLSESGNSVLARGLLCGSPISSKVNE